MLMLAVLLILLAQSLAADSIRCGRKVVREGDSPATLLAHCGEPLYRGKGYADVKTAEGKRSVRVEQWHYKQSERSLERIVLVYRGAVVGVQTGSR
jgi:hypothetical protein